MSSFWQQVPFARLLLPFVMGIICAEHHYLYAPSSLILLAFTIVALFLWDKFNKKIMRDHFYGILFSVVFFFLGFFCFYLKNATNCLNHFSEKKTPYLLVQILEKPQKNNLGYKSEAIVIAGLDSQMSAKPIKGKLLLYFKNLPLGTIPTYGEQIVIKSDFHDFSAPKNPGAFDYKKYMAHKGIFQAAYLTNKDWFTTGLNNGNKMMQWVIFSQTFIRTCLQNYLDTEEEIAISEALLYGYDKDIDAITIDAFSKTGTLHVLAVSGMHVGMIFMLLGLFLKPLERKKQGKLLAALIQLLGIWAYSLLCGFTPSILRATVMFSFVIVGKQIKRGGNAFNSLAASAQFLLLFDPNMLFNVGFQLSYAAVLGILGFYPNLYFLFTFKQRISDEIWKIIAVSIAAQMLTLPMSIFYFHQMPNYFLLANLLIIPLSSLIIYLGIFLLAISWWPLAANYIGILIGFLIHCTNAIAKWIAELPYSYTDGLFWTPLEISCFYFSLICLMVYLSKRDVFQLKIVLGILLLLQAQTFYLNYTSSQNKKLLIYHCNSHSLVQYIEQSKAYNFTDSIGYLASKHFKQNIANNMLKNGYHSYQNIAIDSSNTLLKIGSNRNLLYWQLSLVPIGMQLDYLLVVGNKHQDLQQMLANNRVRQIILNPNMSRRKRAKMLDIALKMKIPVHDIAESGAFELSL